MSTSSAQFHPHFKTPTPHRHNSIHYHTPLPIPFKFTSSSPQPSANQIHLSALPHRHRPIQLSTSDHSTPSPNDAIPEKPLHKPFSAKDAFAKLRRYGSSGILAYGILNTAYYTTTFLVVWFYVAPASGRFGYVAAVKRFVKVMAMVWAGSQVTKVARAAGAVALAPFVEKGLTWCSSKFKFRSRASAYMAAVGVCVCLALLVFLAVTFMSA